jgi:hypothetical protein
MSMARVGKSILASAALAVWAAGGASDAPPRPAFELCAQEPPGKPKEIQEAKEKKARDLWEQAEKFEKDGKLMDAQAKLRELRTRYRGTAFYFEKMELIAEKINEFGLKVAVGSLQKTSLYKRAHQDSWFGYEFTPPDGWKGVPPMAMWFGEFDNDETFYKGKAERVTRYTSPYLDKLYMSVYKVYACTSHDYLEMQLLKDLEPRFPGLKEEGKGPWQGNRMAAVRKTYTTTAGDRLVVYYYFGERRGLALCGVWRSGGEEDFAITITTIGPDGKRTVRKSSSDKPVTADDFAHAQKIFDQAAKTFWIYDAATRQGKATLLNRSALCSDWNVMRSSKGSYLIEYGTSPEYAKRCGEELEQILALYRQVIPSQKGIPQCRVKVFDREDDFMYYSGAYGAAAYWSPGQEEIVCYKFEGDKVKSKESSEEFTIAEERAPEEVTFKILYHEGFHQYMYYLMGRERGVYVPSWINEGLGDYFFGGEWQKSPRKFSIGINDWRIKRIYDSVKAGKHVPLAQIIRYEQMQYYRNPGLCYAEGWSINYFLLTSPVAKAKGWNLIPQRMLESLKGSGNWEKATDKVFTGVDLKAMEEEWKTFVLALPIPKHLQTKDEDGN